MLPLDTRQARIARRLLDGTAPTNVDTLASEVDLTPRVVRYNLPSVEGFLRAGGIRLVRRRGVGVWLDGTAASRRALLARLDERVGPTVVDAADRRARVIVALLDAFPDPVRLETLEHALAVSRPTVRRDVRGAENPFLGVRALRLAATRPDLFLTQLRACYRAATAGPVKVMAPMVADAGDVTVLLDLAAQARGEAAAAGHAVGEVDLGVMLEIPSAVLTADAYFDRIAFASLGTNDLLQYTLAADRGNAGVERYQDPLHPAVLGLIRSAVAAGERVGVDVSVCGEMAGDPIGAQVLVGLGVRTLSMSAPRIPAVRRAIRAAARRDLEARALASLGSGTAGEVRAAFS